MRRKVDPQAAKAKKQKKLVIIGSVLLVAVLAFQVPRTLKQLNAKPPEAPVTAPNPAPPATAPGPGGQLVAVSTGSSARVAADPDPAPVAQGGQLVSFNLFKSKDPFLPQLSSAATNGGGSPPASSPPATTPPATTPPASTPPASSPPASEPPASTPPSTTPPATTPPATTPPASSPPATEPPATTPPATTPPPTTPPPAPTAATISVNGVSESVQVGGAFPKANPLFRLVAIKNGLARIGIAGGSLQDGAPTVSLARGKTVTLMNTADGTKYVIKLIALT